MKTIYVLCNIENLKLVKPLEVSKVLLGMYFSSYIVALYNIEDLEKIKEDVYYKHNAWWREIGFLQMSQDCLNDDNDYYQPRVMRKMGLFNYIYEKVNLSTEKHLACAIGNFSSWEGKNPIEFFNSIKKL